jgi:uncharacterized heparinase superfamily protein
LAKNKRQARQHKVANPNSWRERQTRFWHRYHARRAGRAVIETGLTQAPVPRTIGVVAKGQQLIAGDFLFSGFLIEGSPLSIWDIAEQQAGIMDDVQGCAWLDDLAAVGDEQARTRAQTWVHEWIARYGDGRGAGWTPGITGRRVMRWLNHSHFLLRAQDKDTRQRFLQSIARQTVFLGKRWPATAPGPRRFEALAGTIQAGLTLSGMSELVDPAIAALCDDCQSLIDAHGAIQTRNPEQLLEIFSLLNWTAQTLDDSGRTVTAALQDAIHRIAITLRAVRHADGSLGRFHGGGSGIDGRLDEALATSGVRAAPDKSLHMGFARLTGGRTTIIADAAAPPGGDASADGHASTLAFELTSGRRPLIVNCGSGARFGTEWRRASRATPSHSTMMIEGVSSSHLAPRRGGQELLTARPAVVYGQTKVEDDGLRLELSQNGYKPSHGLTHARTLKLSVDGRTLQGEDLIAALDHVDEARFDRAVATIGPMGIPYAVRFHLHPDVQASLDSAGHAITLRLKSGEVWLFRHDGEAELRLSPSVYLQNGRLKPRPAQQVVLSGSTLAYATRVRWSLAKAQDTPQAVRDLVQADLMDVEN